MRSSPQKRADRKKRYGDLHKTTVFHIPLNGHWHKLFYWKSWRNRVPAPLALKTRAHTSVAKIKDLSENTLSPLFRFPDKFRSSQTSGSNCFFSIRFFTPFSSEHTEVTTLSVPPSRCGRSSQITRHWESSAF